MEESTNYNSFDELKNSSVPAEARSDKSTERHEQFAEAMRFLRNEYIQSKASIDTTASVSRNTLHGLR